MLTGPSQSRSVLPKSAQFRGLTNDQYRVAEMSYAEWGRADDANESNEYSAQTLCIHPRDWAGDLLVAPTLKLVAVPRWIRRETRGRVLAAGVAAIERS